MNDQNASPLEAKKVPNDSGDNVIALAAAIRERGNAFIVAALAERGIGDILPAHGAVLQALFAESPIQMRALAERIGRKKNTVTGLIDTLEARGYCVREADPDDRRAQRLRLTEKGAAMRQVQTEISAELRRAAWAGIDAEDRTACMRALEKVLENLGRGKERGG